MREEERMGENERRVRVRGENVLNIVSRQESSVKEREKTGKYRERQRVCMQYVCRQKRYIVQKV